jgi:hypothetical protein
MYALLLPTVLAGALPEPGPPSPFGAMPRAMAPSPPLPSEPGECGLEPEQVPDFNLLDLNPNSATYNERVDRDDQLGQVMVIYFAQAS